MFHLLITTALAGGPTLLLVGDTGEDAPMSRAVSRALAAELADPRAAVVALGDLYYDAPPPGADCAVKVEQRYRTFYGAFPERVFAILGNHDLMASDDHVYSPEARACSEAAFSAMGWAKPASHLQTVDRRRVKVDLVMLDAGYYGEELAPPRDLPLRNDAHWRFYAAHYAWRTANGKCSEADKIPVTWLGAPPMDLWLNGHAHHLELTRIDTRAAVTSGGGYELRVPRICEGVTSQFAYTGIEGRTRGGYIRLEVQSKKKLRLTPVLCEDGGGDQADAIRCVDQPAFDCRKDEAGPGGRGVSCAPA